MKLELKHLAPYLPYDLQMAYIIRGKIVEIGDLNKVFIYRDTTHPIRYGINYNDAEHEWMFKPILRPLSSMIEKESDEIEDIIGCNFYIYASGNGIEIEDIIIDPWGGQSVLRMETLNRIYEWLFKNHFDVFNLIENNLAIDKTEIK